MLVEGICMGYDLHITRANDWADSESIPITLEEWIAFVNADSEMRLNGVAEVQTPDGLLRYENEGLAVWTKWSGHDEGGSKAWFDYRHGCIIVKNPGEQILVKMKQIAVLLGAKVIGDEGELY